MSIDIKKDRIQEIVNKICIGNFSDSDIGMLFIWLRPNLKNEIILLDLAHFIAHSEGRDKGIAFDYVKKFVLNFLSVSENGGTIFGMPPLFKKEEIITNLENALTDIGISFSKEKLLSQKEKIIMSIQKLMEETEFKIKDSRVIRCYIKRSELGMQFCLQADLKGPRIIMSPGASVCSNLFD